MKYLTKKEKLLVCISILLLVSCNNTKQCDLPATVTYKEHITTAIETNCFMCHAEDVYKEKASRYKIYNYEHLKKSAQSGQLIGSITHAQGYIAMPYRKGVKIDSCTIELIKKWVVTGMQQ